MPTQIILLMDFEKIPWRINTKLGRLYMNRFVIDEQAEAEVIAVLEMNGSFRNIGSKGRVKLLKSSFHLVNKIF